MRQNNQNAISNEPHVVKSTRREPFHIEFISLYKYDGALRRYISMFLLLWFVPFMCIAFLWIKGWITLTSAQFASLGFTIFCLFLLINVLPLLAQHEIYIDTEFKFRSSIYRISLNRKQTTISLKNEKKRKWLRLLNKKVLNTNLFALLMSGVLLGIFTIGIFISLFITMHEELLLIALFILLPCILLYVIISRSAHILVSDNKHKIKIYALNPEWLMRQLAESGS